MSRDEQLEITKNMKGYIFPGGLRLKTNEANSLTLYFPTLIPRQDIFHDN